MSTDLKTWGYEQGSPSNTVVEVKEMTAEETFYSYPPVVYSEATLEYVAELERKLKSANDKVKSKNQALRELFATMNESRPNELNYFKGEIERILKL